MSTIRVLGLRCDGDEEGFVTLGSYFHNYMEVIDMMAKPHTVTYEVRYVDLIDMDGKDIRLGPYVKFIDEWWELLGVYDPGKLFMEDEEKWKQREFAFQYFWDWAGGMFK